MARIRDREYKRERKNQERASKEGGPFKSLCFLPLLMIIFTAERQFISTLSFVYYVI